MAESNGKRPRSDSVGSNPESKRLNLESKQETAADVPVTSEAQEVAKPVMEAVSAADDVAAAAQATDETNVEASTEAPASEAPAEEVQSGPPMTMKALIVTQDASIIIGKSGVHIREIRDKAGAKVGVSEAIPNNPERILSVTGPLDAVSKAYGLIVRRINDEPYDSPSVPGSKAVTIRFIVPNSRMGSVIGKGGSKIKEIQEASGARLQASEAMLPGSTERVLTIAGVADAIHIAVYYVGTILVEPSERAQPNTPYRPGGGTPAPPRGDYYPPPAGAVPGYRPDYRDPYYRGPPPPPPSMMAPPRGGSSHPSAYQSTASLPGSQTQQMFVPEEYVRSIIGKGGQKINEIRQASATHIKIMEPSEQSAMNAGVQPGERLVTVTGQPGNIKIAVDMLYHRLEQERNRPRP